MLLGEKLIAFRDSEGRVGVMDHRCPHRCASLFLGRNEEGGLRCIYHGWKFDVAGNCVDMPSVPPPDFKQKVKAKAYRAVERAGVVWVYMGARAEAPPLPGVRNPRHARGRDPASASSSANAIILQALEGEIDTSHFGFLHAGHVDPDELAEDEPLRYTITDRAPRLSSSPKRPGARNMPATARPAPDSTYWRFGNFLFPFWTQAPNGEFASHMHARGWVPLDDTHTMYVLHLVEEGGHRRCRCRSRPSRTARRSAAPGAATSCCPTRPTGSAACRMAANPANDWKIDRVAQQNGTIYSGIDGIHLQDQAITESMGPIVDHELEHLAPSDQMITRTRRRLLMAARALRDKGTLPPGADDAERLSRRAQRVTSSATTRANGRTSMPGSWRQACTRRRPSMRPNEVRHFGCASGPLSSSPLR